VNKHVKICVAAAVALACFLIMPSLPCSRAIPFPGPTVFTSGGSASPDIQPWIPNTTKYESPRGYIGPLTNITIAYIGYSNISSIVVNATETLLRRDGGYRLVWIKDPDPSRPVNVDGLLVDGYWLMEHLELGLQYIANVLSIQDLPPRYHRRIDYAEGWPDGPAPWAYYAGEEWAENAKNERPVIILSGFKIIPVVEAMMDKLRGLIAPHWLTQEDIDYLRYHLRRMYGSEDALGWWIIDIEKVDVDLHNLDFYKYLSDNGRFYDWGWEDLTLPSLHGEDWSPFTVEALLNNNATAWNMLVVSEVYSLAAYMEW